jgi:hypothetical protein
MRQQSSSTSNGSRFKDYYFSDGDVTFRVENALFRVHKFFFHRESPYFQTIFRTPLPPCNDPPGSPENPVVLKDTTVEAFAGLCWVFYNPKYSIYTTTVEKWVEILALAQRWAFKEVEQLCIRELQKMPIPPIDKIHIYQTFHIDRSLLAESFAELTVRPEPLKTEEGEKLGVPTALQITRAREFSRGSGTMSSPIQMNNSELRSVVQDAFGLEEELFLDFLPPQQSHPPTIDTGGRKGKK